MKTKIFKIGFGFFLICLFAACNDSGTDDLNTNPEDQPILKSQVEESIKTPPAKEEVPISEPEIPGSESFEEEAVNYNI